jgi:alpha-tubulin suppressor-like RCC1 family protein
MNAANTFNNHNPPVQRYLDAIANLEERGEIVEDAKLPPHLFSLATQAFCDAVVDAQSTGIVFLGETASGKTESVLQVLSFMRAACVARAKARARSRGIPHPLSSTAPAAATASAAAAAVAASAFTPAWLRPALARSSTLFRTVAAAQIVLQSFGSAMTPYSPAAGRFLLHTQLGWGVRSGCLNHAQVHALLLEHWRVSTTPSASASVTAAPSGAVAGDPAAAPGTAPGSVAYSASSVPAFNVFYQLLAGATSDPHLRRSAGLRESFTHYSTLDPSRDAGGNPYLQGGAAALPTAAGFSPSSTPDLLTAAHLLASQHQHHASRWQELCASLDVLGLNDVARVSLARVLSAILLLGELKFRDRISPPGSDPQDLQRAMSSVTAGVPLGLGGVSSSKAAPFAGTPNKAADAKTALSPLASVMGPVATSDRTKHNAAAAKLDFSADGASTAAAEGEAKTSDAEDDEGQGEPAFSFRLERDGCDVDPFSQPTLATLASLLGIPRDVLGAALTQYVASINLENGADLNSFSSLAAPPVLSPAPTEPQSLSSPQGQKGARPATAAGPPKQPILPLSAARASLICSALARFLYRRLWNSLCVHINTTLQAKATEGTAAASTSAAASPMVFNEQLNMMLPSGFAPGTMFSEETASFTSLVDPPGATVPSLVPEKPKTVVAAPGSGAGAHRIVAAAEMALAPSATDCLVYSWGDLMCNYANEKVEALWSEIGLVNEVLALEAEGFPHPILAVPSVNVNMLGADTSAAGATKGPGGMTRPMNMKHAGAHSGGFHPFEPPRSQINATNGDEVVQTLFPDPFQLAYPFPFIAGTSLQYPAAHGRPANYDPLAGSIAPGTATGYGLGLRRERAELTLLPTADGRATRKALPPVRIAIPDNTDIVTLFEGGRDVPTSVFGVAQEACKYALLGAVNFTGSAGAAVSSASARGRSQPAGQSQSASYIADAGVLGATLTAAGVALASAGSTSALARKTAPPKPSGSTKSRSKSRKGREHSSDRSSAADVKALLAHDDKLVKTISSKMGRSRRLLRSLHVTSAAAGAPMDLSTGKPIPWAPGPMSTPLLEGASSSTATLSAPSLPALLFGICHSQGPVVYHGAGVTEIMSISCGCEFGTGVCQSHGTVSASTSGGNGDNSENLLGSAPSSLFPVPGPRAMDFATGGVPKQLLRVLERTIDPMLALLLSSTPSPTAACSDPLTAIFSGHKCASQIECTSEGVSSITNSLRRLTKMRFVRCVRAHDIPVVTMTAKYSLARLPIPPLPIDTLGIGRQLAAGKVLHAALLHLHSYPSRLPWIEFYSRYMPLQLRMATGARKPGSLGLSLILDVNTCEWDETEGRAPPYLGGVDATDMGPHSLTASGATEMQLPSDGSSKSKSIKFLAPRPLLQLVKLLRARYAPRSVFTEPAPARPRAGRRTTEPLQLLDICDLWRSVLAQRTSGIGAQQVALKDSARRAAADASASGFLSMDGSVRYPGMDTTGDEAFLLGGTSGDRTLRASPTRARSPNAAFRGTGQLGDPKGASDTLLAAALASGAAAHGVQPSRSGHANGPLTSRLVMPMGRSRTLPTPGSDSVVPSIPNNWESATAKSAIDRDADVAPSEEESVSGAPLFAAGPEMVVGLHCVLMTRSAYARLEMARKALSETMDEAVSRIQAFARCAYMRLRYKKLRKGFARLQATMRMRTQRRTYLEHRQFWRRLKEIWLTRRRRAAFLRMRECVRAIQRAFRLFQERQRIARRRAAIFRLRCLARGALVRSLVQRRALALRMISRAIRSWVAYQRATRMIVRAIVLIQTAWRRHCVRKLIPDEITTMMKRQAEIAREKGRKYRERFSQMRSSALLIQRWYRTRRDERVLIAHYTAAVAIQRIARGNIARSKRTRELRILREQHARRRLRVLRVAEWESLQSGLVTTYLSQPHMQGLASLANNGSPDQTAEGGALSSSLSHSLLRSSASTGNSTTEPGAITQSHAAMIGFSLLDVDVLNPLGPAHYYTVATERERESNRKLLHTPTPINSAADGAGDSNAPTVTSGAASWTAGILDIIYSHSKRGSSSMGASGRNASAKALSAPLWSSHGTLDTRVGISAVAVSAQSSVVALSDGSAYVWGPIARPVHQQRHQDADSPVASATTEAPRLLDSLLAPAHPLHPHRLAQLEQQRMGASHVQLPMPARSTTRILISAVACGEDHSVMLSSAGLPYGIGSNAFGQIGQPPKSTSPAVSQPMVFDYPVLILGPFRRVIAVATGARHTLLLSNMGGVYACGVRDILGVGREEMGKAAREGCVTNSGLFKVSAIQVLGNTVVRSVSAGKNHSAAVDAHGRVYMWGASEVGQCGRKEAIVTYPSLVTVIDIAGALSPQDELAHPQPICTIRSPRAASPAKLGGRFAFGSRGGQASGAAKGAEEDVASLDRGDYNGFEPPMKRRLRPKYLDAPPAGLNAEEDADRGYDSRPMVEIIFRKVACGHSHTLLLSEDGVVYACGGNEDHQLGLGVMATGINSTVPKAVYAPRRVFGPIGGHVNACTEEEDASGCLPVPVVDIAAGARSSYALTGGSTRSPLKAFEAAMQSAHSRDTINQETAPLPPALPFTVYEWGRGGISGLALNAVADSSVPLAYPRPARHPSQLSLRGLLPTRLVACSSSSMSFSCTEVVPSRDSFAATLDKLRVAQRSSIEARELLSLENKTYRQGIDRGNTKRGSYADRKSARMGDASGKSVAAARDPVFTISKPNLQAAAEFAVPLALLPATLDACRRSIITKTIAPARQYAPSTLSKTHPSVISALLHTLPPSVLASALKQQKAARERDIMLYGREIGPMLGWEKPRR